jgi:hypothetical protein
MNFFRCFLLLYTAIAYNQNTIERETLSSQGSSLIIANGIYVSQTIGQLSAIGKLSTNNLTFSQGFQFNRNQTNKSIKKLNSNNIICFPNPFVSRVYLKFPKSIQDFVTVRIFALQGKLVFQQKVKVNEDELILDLDGLQPALYEVLIIVNNNIYVAKIIKNK